MLSINALEKGKTEPQNCFLTFLKSYKKCKKLSVHKNIFFKKMVPGKNVRKILSTINYPFIKDVIVPQKAKNQNVLCN